MNLNYLEPARVRLLSRGENCASRVSNYQARTLIENFTYSGDEFVEKMVTLVLMLTDQYDLYEINEDLLDIVTASKREGVKFSGWAAKVLEPAEIKRWFTRLTRVLKGEELERYYNALKRVCGLQ